MGLADSFPSPKLCVQAAFILNAFALFGYSCTGYAEMRNDSPLVWFSLCITGGQWLVFWGVVGVGVPGALGWYGGLTDRGRHLLVTMCLFSASLWMIDFVTMGMVAYTQSTLFHGERGTGHVFFDLVALYGLTLPICEGYVSDGLIMRIVGSLPETCQNVLKPFLLIILSPILLAGPRISTVVGFNFFTEWVDIWGMLWMLNQVEPVTTDSAGSAAVYGELREDPRIFMLWIWVIILFEITAFVCPMLYFAFVGDTDEGKASKTNIVGILTVVDALTDIPEILAVVVCAAYRSNDTAMMAVAYNVLMLMKSLFCVPCYYNALPCGIFESLPDAPEP